MTGPFRRLIYKMNTIKKLLTSVALTATAFSLLTGCSSADKTAIQDTADKFLAIVKSGTNEDIEKYASAEVSEGEFVKTFDSEYLKQNFMEGFVSSEIDDSTMERVESFCSLFSDMITDYKISEVSVDKNGVGTVVAMIDTSFPIDVIDNSEALELIEEQAQSYYAENEEQIVAMYEEKTEEEVEAYIYNDMIIKIIDVYETLIKEASPETYAITLTVEKNAETDSYYVTGVTSYDEASESTTQAATETATTVEATSSATGSSEESDASSSSVSE